MEAETVLYFITGVVILTFIAFCYACYCTCRQMQLKSSSPISTSSGAFWTGNPNTVMTLYPSSLRRQASQRFRQMSWRSLLRQSNAQGNQNIINRSPSPSMCSAQPLFAINSRSSSFSDARGTPRLLTVFYERSHSPQPSATSLAVPEQSHRASQVEINMPYLLHPDSYAHYTLQDLPPPSYEDALRSSTIILPSSDEKKQSI